MTATSSYIALIRQPVTSTNDGLTAAERACWYQAIVDVASIRIWLGDPAAEPGLHRPPRGHGAA